MAALPDFRLAVRRNGGPGFSLAGNLGPHDFNFDFVLVPVNHPPVGRHLADFHAAAAIHFCSPIQFCQGHEIPEKAEPTLS